MDPSPPHLPPAVTFPLYCTTDLPIFPCSCSGSLGGGILEVTKFASEEVFKPDDMSVDVQRILQ